MSTRSGPFRVEVVCTANICRSPYVAASLGAGLDAIAPGAFEVLSSGTLALAGRPPDPGTRRVARERGLVLSGMRATQITPARLSGADLILVMDKDHRQSVIDEFPGAARRTFLLKEFARLLQVLDAENSWTRRLHGVEGDVRARWRRVIEIAIKERERLSAYSDVLEDPFRQGDEAFEVMATEADAAVAAIVELQGRLFPEG